ncbi:retrovirus-related Pol polyprotein from transposon 412 [Trichonephila clavipes]|nr:retrovirus-related Pol polyprotein from transposon 412 [Trichonephila clavipes]
MAHDVPLGGHLGEQKTMQRIKYSFYWPTIKQDVKRFCESCKICQLRKPITYRDRVPIQPLVRPEIPFEVWSVDCIGPLEPPSRRNHHFIICAVDLCTRWAEAIPVKEISAKTTCNVLLKIFTQTGFPKRICSDQGTNFTSKLSEVFLSVMGVSPRFSTPGHPESMGAVERWNRTLKDMLSKNVQEHGSDWDLHLPFLLFAYREIPHSTTGMSPFQLVYGRLPSGPISLLKEVWVGERNIPTTLSRSVEKYLEDLIEKLRKAHEIAAETAKATQNNYASYYNLRSREKQFKVGDKVLVLLPSSTHKLMKTWIGPATIIEITRPYSAKIELDDGGIRVTLQ